MRRFVFRFTFYCILIVFFPRTVLLFPQENGGNKTASDIFPLTLVLESAKQAEESFRADSGAGFGTGFGSGIWKPDWPLDIPPDAFRAGSAEVSACTVEWENSSLRLGLGPEGVLEEFPLMIDGNMAQATVVYRELLEVKEITLSFPSGDEAWKLEFPESFTFCNFCDYFPFIVRASHGNDWFFVNFSGSAGDALETWYDGEGDALGAFGFLLAETGYKNKIRKYWNSSDPYSRNEFYYDSRGFVTEIAGPDGFSRAEYFREDLPRYWELGPLGAGSTSPQSDRGVFSLQWDERDFLVRILGEPESENQSVDYRYEYTLDETGNWTERKETRMIRNFDLLFPSPGTTFRRVLEYRK